MLTLLNILHVLCTCFQLVKTSLSKHKYYSVHLFAAARPRWNFGLGDLSLNIRGLKCTQVCCKKNQLGALISQIYFWNKTLHVLDSSSVHHQKFFTVHAAMVYVIQVC